MKFSGRGEIYSFAPVVNVLESVPTEFIYDSPYYIALIKLEEGPMVTAQLTDFGDRMPEIGMKVEMVTRRLKTEGETGLIIYGYKFRPPLSNPEKEEQVSG